MRTAGGGNLPLNRFGCREARLGDAFGIRTGECNDSSSLPLAEIPCAICIGLRRGPSLVCFLSRAPRRSLAFVFLYGDGQFRFGNCGLLMRP